MKRNPFPESFNPRLHWTTRDNIEPTVYNYGDREDPKPGTIGKWQPVPHCSYSDYSGSMMDKANLSAFWDSIPKSLQGACIVQSGGHGTRALIIRTAVLRLAQREWSHGDAEIPEWLESLRDDCKALADIIDGLEDYPVIDEELMSKLEEEDARENWDSWQGESVRDDIIKARTIDADRSDVDLEKLLEVIGKHCEPSAQDEGHGVGNCSYYFDKKSLAKIPDDELEKCGFHFWPDAAKALDMVEEAWDNLETNVESAVDHILRDTDPRVIARAIAGLPSIERDELLAELQLETH